MREREKFLFYNSACVDQSEQNRWLGKLADSNWFFHVKEALTTACIIAQTIDREGRRMSFFSFEKENSNFNRSRNIRSRSWQ